MRDRFGQVLVLRQRAQSLIEYMLVIAIGVAIASQLLAGNQSIVAALIQKLSDCLLNGTC